MRNFILLICTILGLAGTAWGMPGRVVTCLELQNGMTPQGSRIQMVNAGPVCYNSTGYEDIVGLEIIGAAPVTSWKAMVLTGIGEDNDEIILTSQECGFLPVMTFINRNELLDNQLEFWHHAGPIGGNSPLYHFVNPQNCLEGGQTYRFIWYGES